MRLGELIDAANNWKKKENAAMELNVLYSIIDSALRDAVRMPKADGITWLKKIEILTHIKRIVEICEERGGAQDNLNTVDLTLVLKNKSIAKQLLKQAQKPYHPVLVEYHNAELALMSGEKYVFKDVKANGWISTFIPYLSLCHALSHNENIDTAIAEVDMAITKRNSNKKYHDPVGVDGDGILPTKWDLRKEALLNILNYN